MRTKTLLFAVSLASLLVLALPASAAASAPDADAPTFYEHVLPVLQNNCQTCHRPVGENIGGMIAPMSLMSYEETRPWARSIAKAVKNRSMPPWFATDATTGLFHHERVLTEQEIDTIVTWATSGARAGDAAKAPARKVFVEEGSGGWSLGKPDLVVPMPRYWVADDIADININFSSEITEEMMPEDVWVRGIEFKAGGVNVHHMCASWQPPGATVDAGKLGGNSLGCIALGAESQLMPEGYAMQLPAGATITFSMHYNKEPGEGSGFWDQSELGLIFTEEAEVDREVQYDPIGNMTFEIPPGQKRWKVGAATLFPVETDILALWPHGHLRAVGARYEAFYPNGAKELLLDVPNYDQEWQTTYQYKEPKTIPAGSRIQVTMWFDNTEERARERGFDHTEGVVNGTATTDEMMLGFISYSPTQKIDQMQQLLGIAPPSETGGGGR